MHVHLIIHVLKYTPLFSFPFVYLRVFVTQRAAAEAQQALKDSLLAAQVITVSVTYSFLQNTQDPLAFHLVLQEGSKSASQSSARPRLDPRTTLKKRKAEQNKQMKVESLSRVCLCRRVSSFKVNFTSHER